MTAHGSSNTWGYLLMHMVKCRHHGGPPIPRGSRGPASVDDALSPARLGRRPVVHTTHLYNPLHLRLLSTRGLQSLYSYTASTAALHSTTLHLSTALQRSTLYILYIPPLGCELRSSGPLLRGRKMFTFTRSRATVECAEGVGDRPTAAPPGARNGGRPTDPRSQCKN